MKPDELAEVRRAHEAALQRIHDDGLELAAARAEALPLIDAHAEMEAVARDIAAANERLDDTRKYADRAYAELERQRPVIDEALQWCPDLADWNNDALRDAIAAYRDGGSICRGCNGLISERYLKHGACQNCHDTDDALAGDEGECQR